MNMAARMWGGWCAMEWRRAMWIAFAWTVAWSLVFSVVAFDRMPHIPDGATYLFQAKIFAGGHVTAPPPAVPEFFTGGEMVLNERGWFGKYPPGHALVLVPGVWLGIPWLIPALCAGAAVAGAGVLARRWGTDPLARLTLLLAASSPFLLTHGGMYLAHVSGTALVVWWVLMLDDLFTRPRGIRWALACGIAVGFAAWIRPYTALALATPVIGWCGYRLARPQPGDRARILSIGVGGVLMVAGLLQYNRLTTGDPLLFGQHVGAFAETSRIGFHPYPRHGGYVQYTPARAVEKTLADLWAINAATLGAVFPTLVLAALPLVRPPVPRLRWLAAFPVALVGFQFFYYYSDNIHGPRMYLEATPFLIILAAAGCRMVAERTPLRAGTCLLGLALVWGVVVPWKLRLYGGNYAGLPNLARPYVRDLRDALVFLDTNHTLAQQNHILTLNTPALDGDVVYARDLGPENVRLAAHYPGRTIYRLRYWVTGEMTRATVVGPTFQPYDPAAEAARAAAQADEPSQAELVGAVLRGEAPRTP